MKTEHTKGPWYFSEKGFRTDRQIPTVYTTDTDLRYIAFCDDNNEQNIEETNNIANARLISAAPELFEIVSMLNEHILTGRQSLTTGIDRDSPFHEQVKTAIQKATDQTAQEIDFKLFDEMREDYMKIVKQSHNLLETLQLVEFAIETQDKEGNFSELLKHVKDSIGKTK